MSELLPYAEHDEREGRTAFILPLLAASLILALIGVISVVNGGDDGTIADPAALILGAPDALEEAGSARMAMSIEMDGGGMSVEMGGDGLVDFVTGAAELEMSVMGMSIEMRTDGELLWLKMPTVALPPGVEGSWVEVPVEAMPGVTSSGMPGAPSDSYVALLRGLSSEVEDLGTEEIEGFETHHYRFDVSIDEALAELDGEDRAAAEQSLEALGGADTFPVDLWITEDGLPIRQVMTMELVDEVMAGTMVVQVDMSDFGVDVDIEPPPAEDIISFDEVPELEEMFGSGMTS